MMPDNQSPITATPSDKWPAYHTTASCWPDQNGMWWVQVWTRWTSNEIDAEPLNEQQFTVKAADAALAQLGWTRDGSWSVGDPEHCTCDVYATDPTPFRGDYARKELEAELALLDKHADRLRRQLAILRHPQGTGPAELRMIEVDGWHRTNPSDLEDLNRLARLGRRSSYPPTAEYRPPIIQRPDDFHAGEGPDQ